MRVGEGKETDEFKQKSSFIGMPSPTDVANALDSTRMEALVTDSVSSIDDRPPISERPAVDTLGINWCNHSLYHGAVYGVVWGDEPISDVNSELDAAIGVDQEEALAALVSTELQEDNNKEDDERREIEKYLVGFTHNLLGELNSLDGLDRFEKARHKMTFHPVDSGILFDYVQEEIQREWLPDNRISETVMAAMKKDKLYSQSDAARGGLGRLFGKSKTSADLKSPLHTLGKYDSSVMEKESSERVGKVTAYGAPRYYETKDPVLILSNERVSTRPAKEGKYHSEGKTRVRTEADLKQNFADLQSARSIETKISLPDWLPQEIPLLLREFAMLSVLITSDKEQFQSYNRGENQQLFDSQETMSSHVAIQPWSQPWLPILADVEVTYTSQTEGWALGEVDYERDETDLIPETEPITMTFSQRLPLTRSIGNVVASHIRRFLDEEADLDEQVAMNGVLDSDEELQFEQLINSFENRDLHTVTLSGIDDEINGFSEDLPMRSGTLQINKLSLVDAYGQVDTIRPEGLLVAEGSNPPAVSIGISLENENDDSGLMVLRPRLTKPARLDVCLLANDNDSKAANAAMGSVFGQEIASNPICGYLLPDHVEWAMEVFDSKGESCGQLRVAERDWSLGGIQKGKLAWDNAPGADGVMGALPASGNEHLDKLLNAMYEIGLVDEQEEGISHSGEGVLSAMLRSIDVTTWHNDPFGNGGGGHPSFFMGRPVAVVRASLRLQVEGGSVELNDKERAHKFQIRLGSIAREIDGLLGYFVNDNYKRFHAVYPLDSNGQPEFPDSHSIDHPYVVFDPTIDVLPEKTIHLTLLMNPQSAFHITSGFLPQKEITLLRDHWEDAVARIAPTFKIGPVLVDPSSVRMPIDESRPSLSWSWIQRQTPSQWEESPIKRSDSLAGLPTLTTEAFEGWLKLDIDEQEEMTN